MPKLAYYLYNHIPGTHPTWTLAVLAVSQSDADKYVKACNGGGKRVGEPIRAGAVKADCGAVTSAAEEKLKQGGTNAQDL